MGYQDFDWSVSGVLAMLRRHKKLVVICPALALLLGWFVIVSFPRSYRSHAKLFLQIGRESVGIDPTAAVGQKIDLQQSGRNDEVQSAMEVLRSREVIGAAIKEVGVETVLGHGDSSEPRSVAGSIADLVLYIPRTAVGWVKSLDPVSDMERAVLTVEEGMGVSAERNSAVIVVKYDAKTPQLAQEVCNALVKAYEQEYVRIHRNPSSGAFFDDQRDLLKSQLDTAEQHVREAKDELHLSSVDQRRNTLEEQFSATALRTYETEQELATATGRIAVLEQQLKDTSERLTSSEKSIPNVGADLLREQYYKLQLKEMDLKARYNDNHPLVVAVAKQVAEAQDVIQNQDKSRLETTSGVNPIYIELSLDLKKQLNVKAGLESQLVALKSQGEQLRADLKLLNDADIKLAKLERDADFARRSYLKYADYFEEARIDRELELNGISNVSELQPASLQEKPISPSKMLVALASLMLAVFGTAAAVLLMELRGRKASESASVRRAAASHAEVSVPPVTRELVPARNGG